MPSLRLLADVAAQEASPILDHVCLETPTTTGTLAGSAEAEGIDALCDTNQFVLIGISFDIASEEGRGSVAVAKMPVYKQADFNLGKFRCDAARN
jgi:hypothetical protein